jgi:hypothetical protein
MKTREPRPERLVRDEESDDDATTPMERFKRVSRAVLNVPKAKADAAEQAAKRKKKRPNP